MDIKIMLYNVWNIDHLTKFSLVILKCMDGILKNS